MELDHMNICAPAELLEVIREFYCEVLGFSVGPRPAIPIPGYWLYAAGSSRAAVHLLESAHHSRPDLNYLDHIAFRVDTLAPIRTALEARGIEYGYLDLADFKIEQINFLDPCGVKIEINAHTS
jgi:catechol 2,3-dioxygenase-like lactoylglutathione lyase family enzyme